MVGIRSIEIPLEKGKKVFFASDLHLGAPDLAKSHEREKKFVAWLDEIAPQASALFILGDLFDFWFEYKQVVPKGFVRVLGKLATMADQGLPIYFFRGNHDLWLRDYLEKEIGMQLFMERTHFKIGKQDFLIGHGDGLGPDDKGFKRMKKVFIHPLSQWLFRQLHPDFGVWFGNRLSQNNKVISGEADAAFLGEDKEWLAQYARLKLLERHYDYFIFGHRHLPMDIEVGKNARYINLGDWISYFTYAVYDGQDLSLLTYETNPQ